MKMNILALVALIAGLVAMALMMGGCTASPSQQYVAASDTYSSLLNSLSDLKEAGILSDMDKAQIEPFRAQAANGLDVMKARLEAGEGEDSGFKSALALVKRALIELASAERDAKARGKKQPTTKGAVSYGNDRDTGVAGWGVGRGAGGGAGRIGRAIVHGRWARCHAGGSCSV